jgi:hypothetical protein
VDGYCPGCSDEADFLGRRFFIRRAGGADTPLRWGRMPNSLLALGLPGADAPAGIF